MADFVFSVQCGEEESETNKRLSEKRTEIEKRVKRYWKRERRKHSSQNGADHAIFRAHGLRVLWRYRATLHYHRHLWVPAGGQRFGQIEK